MLARSARLLLAVACGVLAPLGCATPPADADWNANLAALGAELDALRRALDIPGLAWAVVEDGAVLHEGAVGQTNGDSPRRFTTSTPLRFASVTKSMTAVMVLQLVEEHALDLDTAVADLLPERDDLHRDVRVRHLLSHTSEGRPGYEYVYSSSRFALLGRVIETAGGEPFETALRRRIIDRSGMAWFDSPRLGPQAGLVSTVEEMARYAVALDRGELLGEVSLPALARPSTTPEGRALPVGAGWFAQTIQGERVAWSYGQDDPEHSGALLLRIPRQRRTLILLANRNVLSDPFRLLMGDARRSPFAMTFFRLLVASVPGEPLPRPDWETEDLATQLDALETAHDYSWSDELIGTAIVRSWTGRDDEARTLLRLAFRRYDLAASDDPVLHFIASQLPAGPLKAAARTMGERLLTDHPENRWVLLTQAGLRQSAGEPEAAAELYERILSLRNQEPDFLHRLFRVWSWGGLARIHRHRDPGRTRSYLRRVLESGIEGDMRDDAERMLRELG